MKYPSTAERARVSEIFSSIQGEGVYAGQRHLFIRFEECHIHCEYCDELHKTGEWQTLNALLDQVAELERLEGPHNFISLTGGEPLLYVPYLQTLLPALKHQGFRTYLETNGILHEALEQVVGWCDCIAMDMKPASVTKEGSFESEHRNFLKLAVESGKEVFVKMIVSNEIDVAEYERLLGIVADVRATTPVLLSPLSAEKEGHEDEWLMALLRRLQQLGLQSVRDVRVTPRLHKILHLR